MIDRKAAPSGALQPISEFQAETGQVASDDAPWKRLARDVFEHAQSTAVVSRARLQNSIAARKPPKYKPAPPASRRGIIPPYYSTGRYKKNLTRLGKMHSIDQVWNRLDADPFFLDIILSRRDTKLVITPSEYDPNRIRMRIAENADEVFAKQETIEIAPRVKGQPPVIIKSGPKYAMGISNHAFKVGAAVEGPGFVLKKLPTVDHLKTQMRLSDDFFISLFHLGERLVITPDPDRAGRVRFRMQGKQDPVFENEEWIDGFIKHGHLVLPRSKGAVASDLLGLAMRLRIALPDPRQAMEGMKSLENCTKLLKDHPGLFHYWFSEAPIMAIGTESSQKGALSFRMIKTTAHNIYNQDILESGPSSDPERVMLRRGPRPLAQYVLQLALLENLAMTPQSRLRELNSFTAFGRELEANPYFLDDLYEEYPLLMMEHVGNPAVYVFRMVTQLPDVQAIMHGHYMRRDKRFQPPHIDTAKGAGKKALSIALKHKRVIDARPQTPAPVIFRK